MFKNPLDSLFLPWQQIGRHLRQLKFGFDNVGNMYLDEILDCLAIRYLERTKITKFKRLNNYEKVKGIIMVIILSRQNSPK